MKQEIERVVAGECKILFDQKVSIELTRPDEQFGDYTTSVALRLAAKLNKKPREIAEQLASALREKLKQRVKDITIAGPGFLNLTLADSSLWQQVAVIPSQSLKGKTVVAEYSDPNPFKVLHVGHLYTSVVGDAIASLLQVAGARVHKVNYGGDVGLHVGKTMWAILKRLGGEHPEKLREIDKEDRPDWLTEAYIEGNNAYEDDETAKTEIIKLNKAIYQIHADKDKTSPLAQTYWTTHDWSYDYFETFYKLIGTTFEKYYKESETAPIGLEIVTDYIGKVFEKSDGAVVFHGDKHDLHTRVFINSEGLPTYETKDIGLIMKKWQDYRFDRSIVITGNEQAQYMAVVLKALEQFEPKLAKATTHLTHGMVKMAGGIKMSSRKGNILRAVEVLEIVQKATEAQHQKAAPEIALGAVKYAFLKQRMGGDIVFDVQESVAVEGNSGPYLQYAHARARSILSKTKVQSDREPELQPAERSLLRKIGEFTEVVDKAVDELMPHYISTYLYELAQNFNRFYEKNRVIGDERQGVRSQLVKDYADTLKDGLSLLNISAPESM